MNNIFWWISDAFPWKYKKQKSLEDRVQIGILGNSWPQGFFCCVFTCIKQDAHYNKLWVLYMYLVLLIRSSSSVQLVVPLVDGSSVFGCLCLSFALGLWQLSWAKPIPTILLIFICHYTLLFTQNASESHEQVLLFKAEWFGQKTMLWLCFELLRQVTLV